MTSYAASCCCEEDDPCPCPDYCSFQISVYSNYEYSFQTRTSSGDIFTQTDTYMTEEFVGNATGTRSGCRYNWSILEENVSLSYSLQNYYYVLGAGGLQYEHVLDDPLQDNWCLFNGPLGSQCAGGQGSLSVRTNDTPDPYWCVHEELQGPNCNLRCLDPGESCLRFEGAIGWHAVHRDTLQPVLDYDKWISRGIVANLDGYPLTCNTSGQLEGGNCRYGPWGPTWCGGNNPTTMCGAFQPCQDPGRISPSQMYWDGWIPGDPGPASGTYVFLAASSFIEIRNWSFFN